MKKVLSAAGNDNTNANPENIILTIKDAKLYVSVVTLSARNNQKLSKVLSKGFERSVYWYECKAESESKNRTNQYRYCRQSNFVGANRFVVLDYTNEDDNAKRFNAWKYYLPKGIIDNYNIIINEKNFYGHTIDSDIKRYEELRKLTTGQGKDYTARCLLDYVYAKNHYRSIAIGLKRRKEFNK